MSFRNNSVVLNKLYNTFKLKMNILAIDEQPFLVKVEY